WTIMPSNRIFLGLHFVVAKCNLNARKQIRNGRQYTPTNIQPIPIVFMEHGPDSSIAQQGPVSTMIQVNVEQIVESKSDDYMEVDVDLDANDSPV
ncbi:hypothetical protein BDR03DRAFT_956992, partial [Suillus americanus]